MIKQKRTCATCLKHKWPIHFRLPDKTYTSSCLECRVKKAEARHSCVVCRQSKPDVEFRYTTPKGYWVRSTRCSACRAKPEMAKVYKRVLPAGKLQACSRCKRTCDMVDFYTDTKSGWSTVCVRCREEREKTRAREREISEAIRMNTEARKTAKAAWQENAQRTNIAKEIHRQMRRATLSNRNELCRMRTKAAQDEGKVDWRTSAAIERRSAWQRFYEYAADICAGECMSGHSVPFDEVVEDVYVRAEFERDTGYSLRFC